MVRLGEVALAALIGAPVASGALVAGGDGTQNTSAPPGSTYWNNLGYIGTGGSGVYLGNGWALTAAHVQGGVDTAYAFTVPKLDNGNDVDFMSTPGMFTRLRTTAGGLYADVTVFHLDDNPLLQRISPVRFGATPQVGTGITITGSGFNRQPAQHYWLLDDPANPETTRWVDVTGAPNQNTGQASGYLYDTSSRTPKRWGTNSTVAIEGGSPTYLYEPKDKQGNVVGQTRIFGANFDPIAGEAQVVNMDSGGGVFAGNRLVGINLLKGDFSFDGESNPNNLGQPANTAVFGNSSYFADLYTYVDQIASITKVHPGLDGDANLDGVVDTADFRSFYAHVGTGTGWTQGDFDLDGQVTFTDYQILQRNWGKSDGVTSPAVAPLPAFAEVPEPGALMLLGLGGAGALRRRGRRRRG
jgi:hypothetical protein